MVALQNKYQRFPTALRAWGATLIDSVIKLNKYYSPWMSMLPNRPQDAFVHNPRTGEVDPINLIATDKVRCLNCNKYFHNTMIQAHMLTHNGQQLVQKTVIPPVITVVQGESVIKPLEISRLPNPNRVRSPTGSSTSTFDLPNEPIDVRTMSSDELPLPQYRRREIELPLPHGVQPIGHNTPPEPLERRRLRTHPNNEFTSVNVPIDKIRERISVGDYYESVQLGQPRNINVVSSALNLKRNMNAASYVDRDDHVDPEKVISTEDIEPSYRPRTYQVTPISHTKTITPETPTQYSGENGSARKRGESIIEVPEGDRFLAAELPLKTTTSKNRTKIFPNVNIVPVTQTPPNNPVSRYTNPESGRKTINSPQKPRSSFPSWCVPPPVQEQQNENVPHSKMITSLIYQKGDNHKCPECGGYYCPTCKATFPPQCRRPHHHPHTLNRSPDRAELTLNYTCTDCHGFYCHYCHATFPPQCRRGHRGEQDSRYQVGTQNQGGSPVRQKEF